MRVMMIVRKSLTSSGIAISRVSRTISTIGIRRSRRWDAADDPGMALWGMGLVLAGTDRRTAAATR